MTIIFLMNMGEENPPAAATPQQQTSSFFQGQICCTSLFVFLIGSCEQNGVSLLTPVSDSVFIALSDGTFLFSLHGSFKNHQHKAL